MYRSAQTYCISVFYITHQPARAELFSELLQYTLDCTGVYSTYSNYSCVPIRVLVLVYSCTSLYVPSGDVDRGLPTVGPLTCA